MTVYVILCDGDVDQISDCPEATAQEKKDLLDMGFEVTVKSFHSWEEAEAFEDKKRGY